jgi:hypothetical protein
MQMNCNAVPYRRLVTVDGNGRLHPAEGDPLDVIADQPLSVAVIWDREEGSWHGWLTTVAGHTVCFEVGDLNDPIFQSWLRALPGWQHARLWEATTNPGIHLVWRRRPTIEIPNP